MKSILVLDNGEMVTVTVEKISLSSIATGRKIKPLFEKNLLKDVAVSKGSYPHYMIKEIYEAPFVIRQVVKVSDAKYLALARAIKEGAARLYDWFRYGGCRCSANGILSAALWAY